MLCRTADDFYLTYRQEKIWSTPRRVLQIHFMILIMDLVLAPVLELVLAPVLALVLAMELAMELAQVMAMVV